MGDPKSNIDAKESCPRPPKSAINHQEFLSILGDIEVSSLDKSLARFARQIKSSFDRSLGGTPSKSNEVREYRPKGFPTCAILTFLMDHGKTITSHLQIKYTVTFTLPILISIPTALPVIWKNKDQVDVPHTVASLMAYVTPVVENVPQDYDMMLSYLGLDALPEAGASVTKVALADTVTDPFELAIKIFKNKQKKRKFNSAVKRHLAKNRKRSKIRLCHGRAKFTVDYKFEGIFNPDPIIPFIVDSPG
jgi:hypothetical protein